MKNTAEPDDILISYQIGPSGDNHRLAMIQRLGQRFGKITSLMRHRRPTIKN
ncbi:MAG: hypothetical protein WC975_05555 [Phycisphaerae bacterium]